MSDFIVPDWPAPAHIRAITTTREGGYSVGPFASFNLADHVGDAPAAVTANRRRLRALLPELPGEPLWLTQVHGSHPVFAGAVGPGVEGDASICRDDVHICAILSADCLPVLLCDGDGTIAAAAHAGWRGLADGVIAATIAAMDTPPRRLLAWLGPAIGPHAFEVGDEVRDVFISRDSAATSAFVAHKPGKWLCDIYMLARQQLAGTGVDQIYGGNFCTFSDARRFFSHRRDHRTGRMATLIWMDHRDRRV